MIPMLVVGMLFWQGPAPLDVTGRTGHLTVKAVEGWKNGDRLRYGRYLVESREEGSSRIR